MSQIILDEQLNVETVHDKVNLWIKAQYLRDLHPGEVIKDERVATLLQELKQPTFVTIDMQFFWDRSLRKPEYCIVCFALKSSEQYLLSQLLRRLLRLPQFRTKALRMGKVVRVSTVQVEYWEPGNEQLQKLSW